MSFSGLDFFRQWVKQHIYKPRIKGASPKSVPILAENLREEVKTASVALEEIEEEVGQVETAIERALAGSPADRAK